MEKSVKNILLYFSLGVCFLLIFFVIKFLPQKYLIKEAIAADSISCSVTPFALKPGEDVTISAIINFTASDVWAVIENEAGLAESHYSLTEDDVTHYSKIYTTSGSDNGQYNIRIVGAVDGTGEEVICNPSTGAEWIRKSLNEIPWSRRAGHAMQSFNGQLWLLGGSTQEPNSDVWRSKDGLNWLKVTSSASWGERRSEFKTIVFNNKLWLMGGFKINSDATSLTFQRDVWNTSDGYKWDLVTATADWAGRSMFGLAGYNNNLWVAGGCTHVNASLVCDGTDNQVWFSADGETWTQKTGAKLWSGRAAHQLINFDDGAVGGEKLYLVGGVSLGPTTSLDDVYYSSDGDTWTLATEEPDWEPRYAFELKNYDNKLWLLGGLNSASGLQFNDIWTTSNGTDWTQTKADVTLGGIGYQASTWTHWAPRRSMAVALYDDGNGIQFWLSGGSKGSDALNDVWKSADGIDWNMVNTHFNAEFGERFQPATVTYNNRLWLMGGLVKSLGTEKNITNDVWSSADGITWRCDFGPYNADPQGIQCVHSVPGWVARWDHRLVTFDEPSDDPDKGEQIFLVGGCSANAGFTNCPTANELRDVWSYNAVDDVWVCEAGSALGCENSAPAWNGRYGPTVTAFNDKIYLMGGYRITAAVGQQVWYSSDGVTWTQTTNATWNGRMQAQSLVFENKLWVLGGWSGVRENDVWSSTDPINDGWTEATGNAAWPGRYTFLALNYNNRMWVISGNVEAASIPATLMHDDVWSSTDGITWNEVTSDAGFIARDFFTGAVFQDRIWLTGGDSRAGNSNEVWATRFGDMTYYVMQPQDWQVNVTATVEPEISLSLSNNACALGVLTADAIQTCGYSVAVATNAQSGYTGYIRQNHGFESTIGVTTHEIHSENGTPLQIEASGTLVGENGEYGVGILTADTTDWPEFTGLCSDYDNQSSTSLPAKAVDWSTAADPDAYLGDNVDNVFATSY